MTRIKNLAITLLAMMVVFAATSARAQFSVLYSFGVTSGTDAAFPIGALAQGEDGSLYSTSQIGGANNKGAAYKITTLGKERLLYSFCSLTNCADGNEPLGGLTLRPNGHLIGTAAWTGPFTTLYPGTIFDISQTGSFTLLYSFTAGTDGVAPSAAPILGPKGGFYGVAWGGGGKTNCGTIYQLTTVFTVIHTFDKVHGCNGVLHTSPTLSNALVLGTDGSFYGSTTSGGTGNYGVVFRLTYRPGKATVFTVLANFDSTTGPPIGALVEGSDGNFYGVTAGVGTSTKVWGSVFKVTPSGVVTILHTLNGTTDGELPLAGLTLATDGNFYGTTASTLFQVTPAGGFSVLHTFGGTDGLQPSNIVQHTNGLLYGVTIYGGAHEGINYDCIDEFNTGCGVVYSWNGNLPPFVSTVQLMGAVGSSVEILGQGFTSATTVSFNGVPASATVQSGTSLWATVPSGATTGFITVATTSGTLTSNRQFVVVP